MTTLLPLDPAGFRRTPWKNGGGVTIDIAGASLPGAEEGVWQGMVWRFGRTAIVAPAPFSDLNGYERMQAVIVGSGLVLETPTEEIDLRQPFAVVRYDGGTPIVSRLENGPVEVVNLIADRALCDIDLIVPAAGETLALPAGIHLVYAATAGLSGVCDGQAFTVPAGHALRIDGAAPAAISLDTARGLLATIRTR